jgi:hypothetical protein
VSAYLHTYLDAVARGGGVVDGARLEAVLQEEELLLVCCVCVWLGGGASDLQPPSPPPSDHSTSPLTHSRSHALSHALTCILLVGTGQRDGHFPSRRPRQWWWLGWCRHGLRHLCVVGGKGK